MSTVYAVAVEGERFLMVYNPRRKGWEMPGGSIEYGESPIEAAVREFKEESGLDLLPISSIEKEGCTVFAGRVVGGSGKGEMEWRYFDHLPDELAFSKEEYEDVIPWALGQALKDK